MEGLLGGTMLSVPPKVRESSKLRSGVVCHCPSGLSGTGLLCTTALAMAGSKYVLGADSTLPQILNNSYVVVHEFLRILFTIHPNHLTLTCEAIREYTLLLLYFKESPLMAN